MKLILTQKEPIDLNQYYGMNSSKGDGSDLVFIGKVRNYSRGKNVTHIDYEIYPEMALKELNKIADEVFSLNQINRLIIIHRYQRVFPGEISILILVSSPHRDASYTASRYIIDEIKKRVPIWKKEYYDDGSEWISERS
jgi:molybdopterin synthase catalytic subunit